MNSLISKFKGLLVITAAIVGVTITGTTASAVAQVQFGSVNNLPIGTVTNLTVTGTGIDPNANVIFVQCTGGDPDVDGVICAVPGCGYPQAGCTIYTTDSAGNFTAQVPVSYNYAQPYADLYGDIFSVCVNTASPYRQCNLQLVYAGGERENEVIAQTNLNFGNVVLPPVGPLNKSDCMNSKWQSFVTFGFKNQGACVSYVAHQR